MLRNLFRSARQKHYFMKLIVYMLLLCMLPIPVFGLFFYHNVQHEMRRQIETANDRYLNQSVNALELIVKQINNGFRQFMAGNTLVEFARYIPADFYDAENGKYKAVEQAAQTDYIISKGKVLASLDVLRQSNDFIHSVYYVNTNKNMVLTSEQSSGKSQFALTEFYDREWDRELAEASLGYPIIMNLRIAKLSDGAFLPTVSLVFRPAQTEYSIVINLNADLLYRDVLSKLVVEGGGTLAVFTAGGVPLLYDSGSDRAPLLETAQRAIAAGDGEASRNAVERENRLVTWRSSQILNWTIASVTDLGSVYAAVASMQRLFLALAGGLVLAAIGLAIVASRSIYAPVMRLLQVARGGEASVAPAKRHDRGTGAGEFEAIRDSLTDAFAARTSLSRRLQESLPAHREKFLRSLIHGSRLGQDEIRERLDYLGIPLTPEHLGVLLVSAAKYGRRTEGIERENIGQLLLMGALTSAIDPDLPHAVAELSEWVFLVLVGGGENGKAATFRAAEAIQRELSASFGMTCTIGIGGCARTAADLPRAYREAEEALRGRGLAGGGEIVYIEDVRLRPEEPLAYSRDKVERLLVFLRNGDEPQTLRLFADIAGEIRASSGGAGFAQAQQVFLLLLVRLLEVARELRFDSKEPAPTQSRLLEAFLQQQDWQAMVTWFDTLLSAMAVRIGEAFAEKNNQHVDRAFAIIEADCGESLSLATVADKLNLSPAHLSRIFKEHAGATFSDYVTQIRIRKSKELLLQTDMQVQEISSRMGYVKVASFIKLFKSTTGVTPGEYRKQHG
ncbi:MAG: helix-turn-helix domain-containing protein [Paenibacillaceae bacterium]|nr:helix-turn-helix domain-containing protein [Paenibacillaceae bacterium]